MNDCERYRALLSGYLDQELTAEETIELNEHLIRCAGCRDDYESLRQTERRLKAISYVEVTDVAARELWRLPYSRLARNAALFLVLGGYASLVLYGLIRSLLSDEGDPFARVAGMAIVVGFLILLGLLLIERLRTFRVDPYREIER